jgi:hypothetical protein
MSQNTAIIESAPFDQKAARAEIQIAWENHKRNGMEFGKVCYEWTARVGKSKGGHGSEGKGLSEILNVLQIPRHIVDYWLGKYECSIGEGIPCPDCTLTFPSKSKLKDHTFKAHTPVHVPVPERATVIRSEVTRTEVGAPTTEEPSLEDRLDSIPPMTYEQRDQRELGYLIHRLESITIAIQQVADQNAKWSKCSEYAEVVALVKKIGKLGDLLDTEDQLTPPPSPGARTKTQQGPKRKTTARKTPVAKPKSATAIKRAVRFYTGMMEESFAVQDQRMTDDEAYAHLLTLHGGEGRYPWKTPTKGYTLPPTKAEFDAEYDAAMKDFEALLADGEVAAEAKVTPEPAKVGRTKTHLAVPPDPLEIHVGEPMCGANTSPWGAPPVIATDGLATCKTCLSLKERYS